MKICVLGLSGASHEILFSDERLTNIRRLMDLGLYGPLESVFPPTPVPAWMCMTTSQDPGSLGVYGLRSKTDHAYHNSAAPSPASFHAPALWDAVASQGKKSILVGVPPNCPPRVVDGISVGCFLTPDTSQHEFTYPASLGEQVTKLVGDYPIDVKRAPDGPSDALVEEIVNMNRKQWDVVRWLIAGQPWDYFHFVDIGLDRVQHAFWTCFDPQNAQFQQGNPYHQVIPDYYQYLDEQIGTVLEMIDDQTIVLLLSEYGAQLLDGVFAVNEWLVKEGLLVLNEQPLSPTILDQLNVNWEKTKAWAEGYADIFFNVIGREPQGIVPADELELLQQDIQQRLDALTDQNGEPLRLRLRKPGEFYSKVTNLAPDLTIHSDANWSFTDSVGYGVHLLTSDATSGACGHSRQGIFVLFAPNNPLSGEFQGARLLDMAPTLLDLAGYEIPESMQGKSLVAGMEKKSGSGLSESDEKLIHDRLAGLGYV